MSSVYVLSKIDGHCYCKTNGQFSRHLRKHELTYKEYFEKYVTGKTPLCSCGAPLTFYQKSESYANSCGNVKCVGALVSKTKQSWTKEQRTQDSIAKQQAAAARTNEQKETQYKKAKRTFIEKYGVEWGSQVVSQKEKSRQSKKARYGNEKYNNSARASATRMAMPPEQKEKINDNRRATNLEKYGVSCVLALPSALKKSAISNSIGRDYVLPSGKVVGIRGHEDTALDKLLETYDESEILFHDTRILSYELPVFSYVDTRRHHMKYYPDIYIPKENKIIEIKSRWWWDGNGDEKYKSRLENNLRKRNAVISQGYTYEVWLFDNKKTFRILNDSDF